MRQFGKWGAVLLLTFYAFSAVQAQERAALFKAAGAAYEKGDYESAAAKYASILQSGYESWEVYYNLGNAYYKQHDIARAILNYERAKRLAPQNEDVEYNLELARLATADRIQELPQFFLLRWFWKYSHLLGLGTVTWVVIAFYLATICIFVLRMLSKTVRASRVSYVTAIITSTLLLLSSTALVAQIYESETRVEAILLPDKIDIKSAPDESATDVFTLHTGVKVEVKDRSLGWTKIRLADGKIGWLPDDAIARI